MNNQFDFLIYQSADENVSVNALIQDDTIWLTQKAMANLFDVSIPTVNIHLKNIYDSEELNQNATIRKFQIVQAEWNRQVSREIEHYNLDAIISVGYRVNSRRATNFRIWATGILKEYMIKGKISAEAARKKAEAEYDIFNKTQRITSDFDKEVKKLINNNGS